MKTEGKGDRIQVITEGLYMDTEGKAIIHAAVVQVSDDLLVKFGQAIDRHLWDGTSERREMLCQGWEGMSYSDYSDRQNERMENLTRELCAMVRWDVSEDALQSVTLSDAGPNNCLTMIWRERIR